MKPDDPELERRRGEAFARAMDALILAALKSHLLAEQAMNEYLTSSGLKKRWIRKLFAAKLKKCKLLSKPEDTDPLWGVLEVANDLRNRIAHTLEVVDIEEKMEILKDKFFACLTPKQVEGVKDQPADFIAMSAITTCAGFVATLESRIGTGKGAASQY